MPEQIELCVLRIANTPTEAQLLKNALEAVEIHAYINDANLLQANTFLSGAIGGVRLLVARDDLERALSVLKELDQGAFVLEGEELDQLPQFKVQTTALFSPEQAMILSLLVTPSFSAATTVANLKFMRSEKGKIAAWINLIVLFSCSAGLTIFAFLKDAGLFAPLAASLGLAPITIASYFFVGREHSRLIINEYGHKYQRRPMTILALLIAIVLACLFGFAEFMFE